MAAAVSNAGGMGSIASALISLEDFKEQLALAGQLTDRPYAVNHSIPFLNEEAFAVTLEARPAVISFALGDPGDLVARAHEAGIKVMHMVNSVQQAQQAAATGVDIINAQGSEAGGFSGKISTMSLVPQVVDAVNSVPVVASGGIWDGRGLAAAITLGAQGVNIGTRFLASTEAPINQTRKHSIIDANSEQTVRVAGWKEIFPLTSSCGYDVAPNALTTDFTDKCDRVRGVAEEDTQQLNTELMEAVRQGRFYELVPLIGQTAGAIHDVAPAHEIVHSIATEAEAVLAQVATLVN
jgi:nitronate monooxygenase/enoyl-[acyl-carrier protein] reductase II